MFYRLSRFSRVHVLLRRVMNQVLWRLPFGLKYAVGGWLRSFRLPYRLVSAGDTVVQVGAPWDLLEAGRSRAWHFARRVGPTGRVVVIEPGEENVRCLKRRVREHDKVRVSVVAKGAWSKPCVLRFLVKPGHPAANIVEEVWRDERTAREDYEATEITVDSLQNMLGELGIDEITLLSITTNGSEGEILKGLGHYADRTRYLSMISTARYAAELRSMGFKTLGADDRGITMHRIEKPRQRSVPEMAEGYSHALKRES